MFGNSKTLDTYREWYDEIDPVSFYEKHFERTFLSNLSSVYPDFIGIPFSLTIRTESNESSDPDLAMIKKDYSEWFVIEMEMSRHSWDNHVDKQVRVFSQGIYEKTRISDYMLKKNPDFDLDSLKNMVKNQQPRVLVVVNEDRPIWKVKAKKYEALVTTFQIFKGHNGLEVYRISGDTPYIYRDKSHCIFAKGLSNSMEIYTPTFITEDNGQTIEVTFREKKTLWSVLKAKGKTFLTIKGRSRNLQLEKSYVLYKSEEGNYFLEIN